MWGLVKRKSRGDVAHIQEGAPWRGREKNGARGAVAARFLCLPHSWAARHNLASQVSLQLQITPWFQASLGPQGLWDPREAQCGCFPHRCLRENPELWSLRTLSQIAIVSLGWQMPQLRRDRVLISTCLGPSA